MRKILFAVGAGVAAATLGAVEVRFTPADDAARFVERVRAARAAAPGESVTVRLAEGEYALCAPLVLTPADSGTAAARVTWRGEGRGAVLSGGVRISGWRAEPDGTWSADLPRLADGRRAYFEQLFVNGRRASRARLPDSGYFTLEALERTFGADGARETETDALVFRAADAEKLAGIPAADVPYVQLLCNYNWERLRRPLAVGDYDEATRTLRTTGGRLPKWAYLKKEDLYAFENLRAAFDAPGEWFYDAAAAKVRYRPLPGEAAAGPAAAAAVAPVGVEHLLEIAGEPSAGRYVDGIDFENVGFEHTTPVRNAEKGPSLTGASQAALNVCSAAVVADGARDVRFLNCRFARLGGYALWLREGCKRCAVRDCDLTDLGAGGVRIGAMGLANGAPYPKGAVVSLDHYCRTSTESNAVENCVIRGGGRFHPQGVGVIITHSSDNRVVHNEIADLYYTGVSVGWVWGYWGSVAQRNEIAYNHIHHLGQGQLADMGGVYTLGTSFGTRVANNVIHDVNSYSYGGWGLYPDEGSEGTVWENNLVYDTKDASFHQHYGRDNVLRNNILCLSRQGQVAVTRAEDHRSVTVERNIIYWDEGPTFQHYGGTLSEKAKVEWKGNLWWKAKGEVEFNGKTFAAWQAKGNDVDGAVADPKFLDPGRRDFRLAADSPALKLGFRPFDFTEAGPVRRTP